MFWELGCGKTIGTLETYRKLREKRPNLKLLVVCPLNLIEGAWGEDINKFTGYKYCNLNKKLPKQYDSEIYIVNYEAFLSAKKFEFIRKMIRSFEFLCALDESSKIKNHKAQTTKMLLSLKDEFPYRLIMSGTPAPNNETEYWPQITFLKKGVFHDRFYTFRNHFFHLQRERNGRIEVNPGQIFSKKAAQDLFSKGFEYALTDASRAELMGLIAPWAHYAKKKDCLDLPEQVDQLRLIAMGSKQRAIYNAMQKDLIVEIQDTPVVATVALTKIMKLRQITSGFAINEDGMSVEIGENPKLKELGNVIEEAGDQQIIIWCQFTWEMNLIKKYLEEEFKAKVSLLNGSVKVEDREKMVDDFKSGRARYLVAHPRSAGHGFTFVNCSLQVFFSFDYSFELYEQSKGRTHRAGQVNKCTYIHLVCKDSIDEKILSVLRQKKDATEILYELIKGYKEYAGKRA